jgi:hypothetical protein
VAPATHGSARIGWAVLLLAAAGVVLYRVRPWACMGADHRSASVGAVSPDTVCPYGFSANPERTLELVARLRQDPEVSQLLDRAAGGYLVCYGAALESAVDPEHRLRLPADQPAEVLAARMAHLLEHVVVPLPTLDQAQEPSERWLEQVRQREARAHELENRVRQRGGLAPLPSAVLERAMDQYRTSHRQAGEATFPERAEVDRGALTDATAGR